MRHKFKQNRGFLFIVPVLIIFGLTAIVMWLWNIILPETIGVNSITYWQALGILVLSKILFGNFPCCKKSKHSTSKRQLRNDIKNMSPEEREKFKDEWKNRFKTSKWCKKDQV